ncbi:hypothetical protein HY496_00845 [Candidatus Woesearchaeota archaeon]|nr:hypothetical protein [Candidatus Woesearchaeota archaeon]
MEKYQDALEKARFQYDAAFHLLNVTYPLIKDPKLLVGILSNISISMENALDAILSYERQLRLVPHYSDNFQSKFNVFRYKSMRRNKIEPELIQSIEMVQSLLSLHRRSLIEFRREDRLILCDREFTTNQVTIPDIRSYLDASKSLLETATKIINRKE